MIFLIAKKAIVATPDSVAKSERTVDMTAEQLANDYDTQIKASMATAVLIKPASYWSEPTPEKERLHAMALYLAAFKTDADEAKEVRDYIDNNGTVRILWLDLKMENKQSTKRLT